MRRYTNLKVHTTFKKHKYCSLVEPTQNAIFGAIEVSRNQRPLIWRRRNCSSVVLLRRCCLEALAKTFTLLLYCWIILTIPYWAILYWSARHLTKLLTGVLRQTTRGTAALKRKKGSRNFQVPFQKSQEQNSKSVIWNWIRCEPERERERRGARARHTCGW